MNDKERIEKLVLTLMHIKNCLVIIQDYHGDPELDVEIDKVKNTIEMVINKNADEIKLDL